MPRKSTIPDGLNALLKRFKVTLAEFSNHTGISQARLIQLFETGNFTKPELLLLVELLSPDFARAFISSSSQKGKVNQTGTGNRQRVKKKTINYNVTHNVVIQVNIAKEADPTALGLQQPPALPVQPGGVVRQLGPTGGVVRQLGPAGTSREVGKAA